MVKQSILMHVGHSLGWSSVFYIFGSLGVVWFTVWAKNASSGPTVDATVSSEERSYVVANTSDQVLLSPCPLPYAFALSPPLVTTTSECGFSVDTSAYRDVCSQSRSSRVCTIRDWLAAAARRLVIPCGAFSVFRLQLGKYRGSCCCPSPQSGRSSSATSATIGGASY